MAQKMVLIPGIGQVVLSKRKGSRNLRLSITASGQIRVAMPSWVPYSAGIAFVNSRKDWVEKHGKHHARILLKDGDLVGKSHRLKFISLPDSNNIKTRLTTNTIQIVTNLPTSDEKVQAKAITACERALKKEAEHLLIQRLNNLSNKHYLKYRSIRIRKLTSRWGSCSVHNDLVLSYFLMQLPWHLIDYVIVHELVHTKHHHHGSDFWDMMEAVLPGSKLLKKEIKEYQPKIIPKPIAYS